MAVLTHSETGKTAHTRRNKNHRQKTEARGRSDSSRSPNCAHLSAQKDKGCSLVGQG